ncbi:MAG: hypothetical protein ABW298_15685 [Candidatus Binatia bacterium]
MTRRSSELRSAVALLAACGLLLSAAPPIGAQAPVSAAATTAESKGPDGGWPRGYSTPSGGHILIYQPQVAGWTGQTHMVAYSAVAFTPRDAAKAEMGTIRIEADTSVAMEDRLVRFTNFHIAEASFPTLDKDKTREVVTEIDNAFPDNERVIGLDRVLAAIDRSQIVPKNVEGVKADPPKIFFSEKPAILLNLDGKAIWSPIKDNDLKYAVNTNWDLFQHEPSSSYFLRVESSWLEAKDVSGPWVPAAALPESFSKLPDDDNWKDVKAAVPGEALDPAKAPTVFVSEKPAEVILLDGEPKYEPVPGAGNLLWVSNTESDVFRLGASGPVYYLVSGRWFTAPDFKGSWTFATPSLPGEFKKISPEHPRSRVLASVPGTPQAVDAILLAQVPETARVKRSEIKAPEVAYAGEPKFEPIEQTSLQRASNTDKAIIKVGDMYYMCFDGVWFMGSSPQGPWKVTDSVPGEIYQIPVSSPVHNVTYVTVEDHDDEWVQFAAVAGYTGMMIAWGCAVSGSGWYYPPYYGWYGGYPAYYPYYRSYGYGSYYNPWTGAYGSGGRVYGPYGSAGWARSYNPTTGTYARGVSAYGENGSRYAGRTYNPRTGTSGVTRGGSNVYGSWNQTAVQRGDSWAQGSRYTSSATGQTTRVARGSGGDVYAGRDGNVYRRSGDSWQKYDNGGWNSVQRPTQGQVNQAQVNQARASSIDRSTYEGLNRDSAARASGNERTRDFSNYQRSSGASASSYRASGGGRSYGGGRGGGMRGGGGRGGGGRRR